ncbi:MAG: hypothetical protein IPN29_04915 [Saprospiraceae bacterium]|nr:hypothetical protein [Saprospiraceae bacterium]
MIKIGELQDALTQFYDTQGIYINFVGTVRFNIGYTTNSYSIRSQAASAWETVCFERDMVHHLTAIQNLGRGESSGENVCEVNYYDEINGVSFSNHEDSNVDWISTLHEVGHDLGFGHVDESLFSAQNGNYLMCEQGPPNSNNSSILLTQLQIDRLTTGINPQSEPCVFENANTDCKFCDVKATYTIDKDFVKLGCNGDNIRLVNIDVKNDCHLQRTVTATISYYPSHAIPLSIPTLFTGPNVIIENINGYELEKHTYSYSYSGILVEDEEECYDFKFQIVNGVLYSDNSYGTKIACETMVSESPTNFDLGESFNLRYKKLVDMSAYAIAKVEDINSVCQCLQLDPPGDSFCKNGRPIKVDFGGIFEVDRQIRFCEACELTFKENSEILVKQGGLLELNGTQLYSCDNKLWKGITVESGGQLIIDEGTIVMDALYGINIKPGAIVHIRNSFLNDNYIGINLNNGSKLDVLENTTIQTLNGVKPTTHIGSEYWSQNTYCGVFVNPGSFLKLGQDSNGNSSSNTFKNINLGIYAQGSTVICGNANFEGIHRRLPWVGQMGSAIYLINSLYNYIWQNTIIDSEDGLRAYKSALLCDNNTIDVTNVGISSYINEGKYTFINNNRISSRYICIDGFYIGKANITNNFLEGGNERNDYPSSGINVRHLVQSEISGNTVNFAHTQDKQIAIALTTGTRNTITDNFITSDQNAGNYHIGFAFLGGYNNQLNCNISYDYLNGIFLDNSTGNEISCNSIASDLEDIRVDRNSIIQMMKGNSMSSDNVNLILSNPIGVQPHHGNKWYNIAVLGADATILSGTEVQESRFSYDKLKSDTQNKKWYPSDGNSNVNSDPANLFFDQTETTQTYECNSCIEGDFFQWFNSSPSPTSLCQWLTTFNVRISPKRVLWWKNYIYRLVKKSGIPYNQLSLCLKDLIDEIENSKQLHVETIRNRIEQLSFAYNTPTINVKYEEINDVIESARGNNELINLTVLQAKLSELQALIDAEFTNLSALKSDILISLLLIDNDTAYEEEHMLYTVFSDYVFNDVLPQDKTTIEYYASNCSEEYAENVYLAKGLLSISDKIDPISISCEEANERSRNGGNDDRDNIVVTPTVSNGTFIIYLPEEKQFDLQLYNSVGIMVNRIKVISGNYNLDISNYISGIYILALKDLVNGKVTTEKVVKL